MSKTTNRLNNIKKQFPEILRECMGLVTKACEKAGVGRTTYYEWRKDDPEFATLCDATQEYVGDFVESKLYKLINDENPTAILFYCKTKLRNKGYVERIETTGKDGGPIEIQKFKTVDTDKAILVSYEQEAIEKAKNKLTEGQTND
jgi:hypothetical protein